MHVNISFLFMPIIAVGRRRRVLVGFSFLNFLQFACNLFIASFQFSVSNFQCSSILFA